MAMGKNSAPMNLTISKKTLEYLQFIADRGTNLGPDPTKICSFILGRELDRMIDNEPNPAYWRQGIGSPN